MDSPFCLQAMYGLLANPACSSNAVFPDFEVASKQRWMHTSKQAKLWLVVEMQCGFEGYSYVYYVYYDAMICYAYGYGSTLNIRKKMVDEHLNKDYFGHIHPYPDPRHS